MNNRHINCIAYEDFELMENFSGNIEAYRKDKIEFAKKHVSFIREIFPGEKITVLELGSGNSKTLFALEKAGILELGYGVEISKSRFKFAEIWKKEWNFKLVNNINANAINLSFKKINDFDCCFCVDLAFQFFEPILKGSALNMLRKLNKKLKKGGKVILELDGCEEAISKTIEGNGKIWQEFPPPDPWRFTLWNCNYNVKDKLLTLIKIFIKRNEFGFSQTKMILKIYKKEEIRDLFLKAGFKKIELFGNWEGHDFKNDNSEYIIVGTK